MPESESRALNTQMIA